MADPEVIAPGIRPAPVKGMDAGRIRAIVSYLRTFRAGAADPEADPEFETAARVFAGSCAFRHQIDGEGGTLGPDLTHIGRTRDARWLREWISDQSESAGRDVEVSMPAFNGRLSDVEIDAISNYLAGRK